MRKLSLAVAFAGVAFAVLAMPSLAAAQSYPSRPIITEAGIKAE